MQFPKYLLPPQLDFGVISSLLQTLVIKAVLHNNAFHCTVHTALYCTAHTVLYSSISESDLYYTALFVTNCNTHQYFIRLHCPVIHCSALLGPTTLLGRSGVSQFSPLWSHLHQQYNTVVFAYSSLLYLTLMNSSCLVTLVFISKAYCRLTLLCITAW